MRVGVIGSGQVGRTLAAAFAGRGNAVVLGTRDSRSALAKQPMADWGKSHPDVKVASFAEAAKHGEVLVLCVHGANVAEAVRLAGPDHMAGKLVLDTTNPLDFGPRGAHLPTSIPDSCLQVAQRAAPKAHLVKAWNCTPGHLMVDPKVGRGDQLICGDDAAAKEQATKIIKDFGWNVADVGDSSMAPYIEGAGLAVINWAAKTNDWGWILKLEGRTAP